MMHTHTARNLSKKLYTKKDMLFLHSCDSSSPFKAWKLSLNFLYAFSYFFLLSFTFLTTYRRSFTWRDVLCKTVDQTTHYIVSLRKGCLFSDRSKKRQYVTSLPFTHNDNALDSRKAWLLALILSISDVTSKSRKDTFIRCIKGKGRWRASFSLPLFPDFFLFLKRSSRRRLWSSIKDDLSWSRSLFLFWESFLSFNCPLITKRENQVIRELGTKSQKATEKIAAEKVIAHNTMRQEMYNENALSRQSEIHWASMKGIQFLAVTKLLWFIMLLDRLESLKQRRKRSWKGIPVEDDDVRVSN